VDIQRRTSGKEEDMTDDPRDFRPAPDKECRICGQKFTVTYFKQDVCDTCFRELNDEYPETGEEEDCYE
jgi:ribosomal protein S14